MSFNSLPDYLEQHSEIVFYQQTRFLLKLAAQELRKNTKPSLNNFYIRMLPNGDFEVIEE